MIKKILLSALLLLNILSFQVFADDVQKNQTYEISDFSGGLSEKPSPFSITPKQATVLENARLNDPYASLSKRTNLRTYGSADAIEPITGMFRHYLKSGDKVLLVTHGDEIEKGTDSSGTFTNILNLTTGDHHWSWVTWHDLAIGSDGYNQPVKYDGTSASATYLGSCLATDAGSGSGPVTGAYTYKISFYSASYEVILNVPSNTITANGNDVNLSMIPIGPDVLLNGEATVGRRVYRTASNGSSYTMLTNGQIANNTATTLTDSDTDAAISGTAAYPSGNATWLPPKGKFILVQNNRLFFANDPSSSPSRVWYSADGSHDVFDSSNSSGYLDIRQNDGDSITFLKGNLGLLTVAKNNTIQKIYIDGADPDADWSISDPLSYVGCQAPYSSVNSPLGIIYLAKDGIYRFNGQYSELISEVVTPTIQDISQTDLENVWGVYHNNFYQMAYKSKASGEAFNNRVLVLDVLAKAYSIDLLNINAFTTFNSGNDFGVLYAGSSTNGNVYAYSSDVNEVVHKRHSDFTGLWDDMRYIPTGVPGGDSENPILEISRTETIDQLTGSINNLIGTIDRQDTQGYYVSQPLLIGATSLDKLYWNETTPGSSDVAFRIRTSPTGERNLLYNDDFEFIDNGAVAGGTWAPNDWTFTQNGTGGKVESDTSVVQRGTYSSKITKSNSGNATLSTIIPNSSMYAGKTMTFSGYVKSANSVIDKVYLEINDGTVPGTKKAIYANGGSYTKIATNTTISASATTITVKCVVNTGANAVAYFDQVMAVQASSAQNDWSAWSSELNNSAGSDISAITANTYLQYLIHMTTDLVTRSPNVVKQSGYNVRLTYGKEGTAASSDIPLHWRGGYTDLGQPSKPKILRSLETYHTGTSGILTIKVENFEGDSDTFNIDLSAHPNHYKEYFTNGALRGKNFVFDVTSSGVIPVTLNKIICKFDTEPDSGIN